MEAFFARILLVVDCVAWNRAAGGGNFIADCCLRGANQEIPIEMNEDSAKQT